LIVPIVVSDTSPIRALDHLGEIRLISEMYGRVIVPAEVARELREPRASFRTVDFTAFGFVDVVHVTDRKRIDTLLKELDLGEAETIALACELNADAVLVDEKRGRRVAGGLGLRVIGTVGILLRAKAEKRIPAITPLLDSLMDELDFFLSPQLYAESLRIAGEAT
jgi:predicted nucleic acid-binding protein